MHKRRYQPEKPLGLEPGMARKMGLSVSFPALARAAVAFALLSLFSFTCRAGTCTQNGTPITGGDAASELRYGTGFLKLEVKSKGEATRTYTFLGTPVGYQVSENGGPAMTRDNNNAASFAQDLCTPKSTSGSSSASGAMARPRQASGTVAVGGQYTGDFALGDFNGDGVVDSAVLTASGFAVNIYGANGQTISSDSYPVSNITSSIVVADFNGDGKQDIAVLSVPSSGGGTALIYLGRGDGTFQNAISSSAAASGYPFYLVAADFNGDTKQDLAISVVPPGSSAGSVAVLIGKGDGTFAAPVNYPVGLAPATIVTADFTGDGITDVAVLDSETGITNKVWVLPGKGDGTFGTAISTATGTTSGNLSYADLNHDGILDLLIADQLASSMVLMVGNGGGTFQAPQRYLSGAQNTAVTIVPLGDGNSGILAFDNASGGVNYFFADTSGAVLSPPVQSIGLSPAAIAAGDVNGDGQPDIAITDSESGNLYVLLSKGKGTFGNPAAYPLPSTPGPLALGDLNNDGALDAIIATSGGLAVLLGSATGSLSSAQSFSSGESFNSVTVADFNKDGNLDAASASGTNGTVSVFLGTGSGGFQAPASISFPSGLIPLATASGDFNHDGKPDLVVALSPSDPTQPGSLAILLGKGDGTFQAPALINLASPLVQQNVGSATTAALGAGDINNDGHVDIVTVLAGAASSQVAVLLGSGTGTFGAPILTATNTSPPQLVIADLNGDGKPDLVLADCCGLSEASYLAGNGDGTFQPEAQFPSGPNPLGVAVADFYGDKKFDIAMVGQMQQPDSGTLSILFDAFATVTEAAQATIVSAANPTPAVAAIAPSSLATAYGADLANTTKLTSLPLPTTVAGTSVSITDSAGNTTAAPLLYISPKQVDFEVPANVASGSAQVSFTSGDGTQSAATIQIAPVAPGLFSANSSGLAAGSALLVSGATQTPENLYAVNSSGAVVAAPVNIGSGGDQAYLILYGTGFRAAGISGVTVTIAGVAAPVSFAGPQGGFAGLDQVDALIPRSLAGKGQVTVQLTANGIAANSVNITIK
jgi:uncharacterized protein (TIGR03437 family)